MNVQFEVAQKQFCAAAASRKFGKPVDPSQLTSSILRSDTATNTGQNYTNISFNKNKSGATATDILLQINDSFIAYGIRLSAKKLTATPTDALHAKAQEFTYPNTFVFDGTAEVTTIFGLWNATISFNQNTDVAFPKIWTGDLKFAPDSQYGSQTGINATPAYSRVLTDSKNSPNYGFFGIEPLLMKGTDQLNATLNLAAALDLTETNEYNFFTISFKGYLISGLS